MTRTYTVETYGCQMNVHDSERIAGLLDEAGFMPTSSSLTHAQYVRTLITNSTETSHSLRQLKRLIHPCKLRSAVV
jgi:tRNA A37 methylthiotransferase MiaB